MITTLLIITIVALVVVGFIAVRAHDAANHYKQQCDGIKRELDTVHQEFADFKSAQVEPNLPIIPAAEPKIEAAPKPVAHTISTMPSPEVKRLFERLEQMMETDGLYYQTGIGRKELSAKLCTNENYLYNIVRQATGMTLQEWINEHRLKYAKEMLCSMKEFDVQQVAIASGFGTARTLQRQFKNRYDTSPIDFYKSIHSS